MLVDRKKINIITFIMMIGLSVILKNVFMAGGITFIIVISGYIIITFVQNRKRLMIVEERCDPNTFMELTEKLIGIKRRNHKINTYLYIDKAAGLILLGKFKEAKEILMSIDKSNLSAKNSILFVYTINMIYCLYELGEVSDAEKLFETDVKILLPLNKKLRITMEILIAERLFYLNKYEASKEKFQELLKVKLSKRIRLEILYRLAQIDEKDGNVKNAKIKYMEVAENGNKLWIAEQAKQHLVTS